MTDLFDPPLQVDDEFGPRAICCLMDAIEFLEEWPFEKRCKVHLKASEACCAAYDGRQPIDAARVAFRSWVSVAGVRTCISVQLDAVERAGVFEIC
ncbi:DUF982 domain-containing protein [Mesorhizobium sp.]|uniref:DUF982 domain-containing protein n=1 Tax=Mesorhizobium sp. TaxID=1871066 RepID=UPI00121DF08D|nr:DUF982 domain-containing protein [Mesorhizobium sp.]TJV19674.1 MAG: DUF982 domain-containing protein [Mesorhizobium sp.]